MIPDYLRAALIIIALALISPLLVPRARAEGKPAAKVSTSPATRSNEQTAPVTNVTAPVSAGTETPTETPTTNEPELAFLPDEGNQPAAEQSGLLGLVMRTVGALFLIVGLVVAGAWLVRRFNGARFNPSREDVPELFVLTTVALGDRRSLAVVRFGEKTFLLGSTAQAITVLAVETPQSALYATPPRSVADLLNGVDSNSFDYELARANRVLGQERGTWHDDGGEA